jgi:murein DD-endopeptidase MepM/ murein hydrolase activator NlpD
MKRRPPHDVLLIMDNSGRTLRRLRLGRRFFWATAVILGGFALLSAGLVYDLARQGRAAAWSQALHRQNLQLATEVEALHASLPKILEAHQRAERQFAQVKGKSRFEGLPEQPLAVQKPIEPAVLLRAIEQQQLAMAHALDYFAEAQEALARTPSVRPVLTAWLSSTFGRRRDPILGHWVIHKGLDLAGHMGDPVQAPADGTVIWTGPRGGYGLTVVVDHGNALQTHYAHLMATHVLRGDHVRRGDRLASMGSSGRSTGPHLHYEVRQSGQPLNPLRFILD